MIFQDWKVGRFVRTVLSHTAIVWKLQIVKGWAQRCFRWGLWGRNPIWSRGGKELSGSDHFIVRSSCPSTKEGYIFPIEFVSDIKPILRLISGKKKKKRPLNLTTWKRQLDPWSRESCSARCLLTPRPGCARSQHSFLLSFPRVSDFVGTSKTLGCMRKYFETVPNWLGAGSEYSTPHKPP